MELLSTIKSNNLKFSISEHSLDYLLNLYKITDGDIELYLVLNVIDYYTRKQQSQKHVDITPPGNLPQAIKRLNTTTLSKISGIPRETVRRKINKLIELGFVQMTGKKYEYKFFGPAVKEQISPSYSNNFLYN